MFSKSGNPKKELLDFNNNRFLSILIEILSCDKSCVLNYY